MFRPGPALQSRSFFFLGPNGPLNLPRFNVTPCRLRTRKTEALLEKPLTFQMSSMECPWWYMLTTVCSRSDFDETL